MQEYSMSKNQQQQPIRNVRAFMRKYLTSKSARMSLERGRTMAFAFADAMAKPQATAAE